MEERLQKVLAAKGVASRRKCEELISAGLVKVNGEVVTTMGTKVDPEKDKIEVNNEGVKEATSYIYYGMNKPKGYITSCRRMEKDEKIILDLIPENPRVFPVGRLDKDSTGLIILTNDGELANRLTHPSYEKEKEYEVTVHKELLPGTLQKLQSE